MPLVRVHTTPSKGRMPNTRERARIMKSTLPPVIFCAGLRVFAISFGPEFVSGAANENIFEGGLAYRERLDLSRKSFDDFGHEAVRALALHADLIFEDRSFHVKAGADALG